MSAETLTAEADRIAARRNDPRTPAVVRRAIARPGAITLRKFLALEEVESPLLSGRWPQDATLMQELCTAHAIVFPDRKRPTQKQIQQAVEELSAEVSRAFSTVMGMRFPQPPGAATAPTPTDGLGWVARLWARVILGGVHNALDMPLDQLFILSAAMSANEGASCTGEDYKDREP